MAEFMMGFTRGSAYVHSVTFKAASFNAAMDEVRGLEGVEVESLREVPEWHWMPAVGFMILIFMQVGLFMLVMARGVWEISSRTADSTTSWIILGMVAFFLIMSLGASRMVRARQAMKVERPLAELVAAVETPQPTFPLLERMGWKWMRILIVLGPLGLVLAHGTSVVEMVLDAGPEQLRGIQSLFVLMILGFAGMSVLGSGHLWRGVKKKG